MPIDYRRFQIYICLLFKIEIINVSYAEFREIGQLNVNYAEFIKIGQLPRIIKSTTFLQL